MKRVHCALLFAVGLAACDGVFTNPHNAAPDATPIDGKRVFTTSQAYRGGLLGGVDGADAICADHASQVGLTGTFKAWLSQVGTNAADRFAHATKPYVLVGDIVVAGSWDQLLQFDLLHAIDRDEHGAAVVAETSNGDAVWTATRIDGLAVPWEPGGTTTTNPRLDCTLWASIDGGVGMLGFWTAKDSAWTSTSTGISCTESAHLYCFEQ